MNLTERNTHKEEQEHHRDEKENGRELWHKPYITVLLVAIIVILLICIVLLLMLLSDRSRESEAVIDSKVQQSITDYAQEQKQRDRVPELSGETVSIEPADEKEKQSVSGQELDDDADAAQDGDVSPVAEDNGKEAVVIAKEDGNDVSYSKEYILNEALPYFADNNQEAISDLAHLKRYVKLSAELKGTNQYYYIGDVNRGGQPDGVGLAIYEDNSYYYGDWANGVRSGTGRWFRFYINEKTRRNAMGKYTCHSYAGEWADNLPDGGGAEHFDVDIAKLDLGERILQNVVGDFHAGLYDGEMFANTVNSYGSIEEWDGSAAEGIFTLWRDMSAIGECSVWRSRQDDTLYMDIDKSENKNQGIRELMKAVQKSDKK